MPPEANDSLKQRPATPRERAMARMGEELMDHIVSAGQRHALTPFDAAGAALGSPEQERERSFDGGGEGGGIRQ